METGFQGTFVISWSQTEVDGLTAAPIDAVRIGATWRWAGGAVCVDGPPGVMRLDGPVGEADIRKRAAQKARRISGKGGAEARRPAITIEAALAGQQESTPNEDSFIVTDGRNTYPIAVIRTPDSPAPLLMFEDAPPPRDRDLWIVSTRLMTQNINRISDFSGGVICFTPGTMIATPEGPRAVEDLAEGDQVLTKDDGAEEIVWVGQRRMSGARLYAMPDLRPVRLLASALDRDLPDNQLLVSPEHRIVMRGDAARDLFGTPEVLVAARDLINDTTIYVDHMLREVTYIHLLLPSHQVLWANGVETESFHPAFTSLETIEPGQRAELLHRFPGFAGNPYSYGEPVRRSLSTPEAAIFLHNAA